MLVTEYEKAKPGCEFEPWDKARNKETGEVLVVIGTYSIEDGPIVELDLGVVGEGMTYHKVPASEWEIVEKMTSQYATEDDGATEPAEAAELDTTESNEE